MQADMEDLVPRLEEYRLEHRIPQEDLAKKLGVAFSTVNRWFNRKTKPNKIQTYHIQKLIREKPSRRLRSGSTSRRLFNG